MKRSLRLALLALGVVHALAIHAGEAFQEWKSTAPPSYGSAGWACENRASFVWDVSTKQAAISVRRQTVDEQIAATLKNPTETPQFSIEPYQDFPRRFIEVGDGYLVGYNKGEWGGGIYWFSRDARTNYRISDELITVFVPHGSEMFALSGVSHLGRTQGNFLKLKKTAGRWTARTKAKLRGEPGPYLLDGADGLLVVAGKSLLRLNFDGTTRVLHTSPAGYGKARSMVRDQQGNIFIGAGRVVIRLTPTGSNFREDWLIHPQDVEACKCPHLATTGQCE